MAGRDREALNATGVDPMPHVSLSRWSLSWFWAALALLITALVLMSVGYGYPSAGRAAPSTLVVVHLTGLGWLSFLMLGALFQFVPVLTARPLRLPMLVLPTLVAFLLGLSALLAGFLHLDGVFGGRVPWFGLAAAAVAAGCLLAAASLGATLRAARPLPLPACFVAAGLASLGATVAFGGTFALSFGGISLPRPISALASAGLPLHIVAGLGGWLGFTAMGVSYRLLSMFMLAPEASGKRPIAVLWTGTGALVAVIVAGSAAILSGSDIRGVLAVAGLLGLVALLLYGSDILRMYRFRMRRHVELNTRMAGAALVAAGAAAVLAVALAATGSLAAQLPAILFLAAFGSLSGLGLSQLYKIVPFLTWLETYGPVLGKGTCPRVQDLVNERRAQWWFRLYFVAVAAGTLCLLTGRYEAFRASATIMLGAVIAITIEIFRTRRLAQVPHANRLPPGTCPPALFFARTRNTSQRKGEDHARRVQRT